jgi:hypothetical protein
MKIIIYFTISFMLLGCTMPVNQVEFDIPPPNQNTGIVVLGMRSTVDALQCDMTLYAGGKVLGGVEVHRAWFPGQGVERDTRYLVLSAKAGQVLVGARMGAYPVGRTGIGRSYTYEACDGRPALTVTVQGGKVSYVTDLVCEEISGRMRVRYTEDIESARVHIKEKYPRLANQKLEPVIHENLPVRDPCRGPIEIPIFLPGR